MALNRFDGGDSSKSGGSAKSGGDSCKVMATRIYDPNQRMEVLASEMGNPREINVTQANSGDPSKPMVTSTSAEWTNEKHSSYLNSIEALFVKQLYEEEYCPLDLGGRQSRRQKLPNRNPDQPKAKLQLPITPIVAKDGWHKDKLRENQDQGKSRYRSQSLVSNHWFFPFASMPSSKALEETSSKVRENGASILERNQSVGPDCGREAHELLANSEKISAGHRGMYRQKRVGCNKEGSDQNFVDDGKRKEEHSFGMGQQKKRSIHEAVASAMDQVVPVGGAPLSVETNENHASLLRPDDMDIPRKSDASKGFPFSVFPF
ncbi:hypothetical protein AMTRI_Chr04g184560 [Amborella trichopoda]